MPRLASNLPSFLLLLAAGGAHAQPRPLPVPPPGLEAFVSAHVLAQAPQLSRVEVQVGMLPRTGSDTCVRAEPMAGPWPRPWGRLAVRVRCIEGSAWALSVPVTVRAWAPALLAASALPAGAAPGSADVRVDEVEITDAPALPPSSPDAVRGRTLTQPVAAGQPIRLDQLRATVVVQAGDTVRLRFAGTGFAVSAGGQALSPAADGQPVRVRTEFGKVLTGVAREGRMVELLP